MIEVASKPGDEPASRIPLHPDEPTTLIEIYEQVLREHPRPDTLNYKRDGAWRSVRVEIIPPAGYPQKLIANYRHGYYSSPGPRD